MRRILSIVLLAASVATCTVGCEVPLYFVRARPTPIQALEVRMDPSSRRECLVILMPGMLDLPDRFLEQGLVRDAARASRRCDFVAVDGHLGYYRDGEIRRRVSRDIISVAHTRGYRDIWLVGVSMGGLGAMMVAHDNPEHIRGVVLFAPFLGDPALIESIREAGGLEAWDPPDDLDPWNAEQFDDALWAWLQSYARDPSEMPQLYIGVGELDDLRVGVELLEEVLPEVNVGRAPGGHGWAVWRVLWRRLFAHPPWDRRGETPSMLSSGRVAPD